MQIFVTNHAGSLTAYDVDANDSVSTLKAQIENKEFIPTDLICLSSGTNVLNGGTLFGNNVEDEDTLNITLEVAGGMRAKWRKKRMRRLRRKRRKMRQRAR